MQIRNVIIHHEEKIVGQLQSRRELIRSIDGAREFEQHMAARERDVCCGRSGESGAAHGCVPVVGDGDCWYDYCVVDRSGRDTGDGGCEFVAE